MYRTALLALLLVAACHGGDSDATCTDDSGNEYDVGESYDVGDCGNTCTCEEGGSFSCTDLGCL